MPPTVSVTPASGTSVAGANVPLTISVDITGADYGTTSKTLTLTSASASNSPVTVPVSVVIADAPTIAHDAGAGLSFVAIKNGSNPANQTVNVHNSATHNGYPMAFTDGIS